MRTSLVLALAAGSVVASGVALSLQVTPSTSSHSSTIADEATTVSKHDSVAVVAAEPPPDAVPAAVLRSSVEGSQRLCGALHAGFSDGLLRGRGGGFRRPHSP